MIEEGFDCINSGKKLWTVSVRPMAGCCDVSSLSHCVSYGVGGPCMMFCVSL